MAQPGSGAGSRATTPVARFVGVSSKGKRSTVPADRQFAIGLGHQTTDAAFDKKRGHPASACLALENYCGHGGQRCSRAELIASGSSCLVYPKTEYPDCQKMLPRKDYLGTSAVSVSAAKAS